MNYTVRLVQECLDDWPYAAGRVVQIMHRLERVKEILEVYDSIRAIDKVEGDDNKV